VKLPHRRQFLHVAAGAAAPPVVSRFAWAQAYPSRPVRIIVGFPAGGPTDILARLVAQWLSDRLGQPVIVENRVGSNGNIATEALVRSAADGYTLMMVPSSLATNPAMYEKLNFNVLRDIAPVAGVISAPGIMVVNPTVPAKSVPEFIAYAKGNPGKINMASPGIGSQPQLYGELFKMMAGVDMMHVPYRGNAPAFTDLLSGQMQVMFASPVGLIEYIQAARLRALAVTTAARAVLLPDIPPLGDFLPGYEASAWYGLVAPNATPTDVVNKLNNEITAGLADPKLKARLADQGGTVLTGSPVDFGKFIADETEKWAKVIRAANIKPE
jgi:tripartite-type tricarboxylate transporter receptor subunit TctC